MPVEEVSNFPTVSSKSFSGDLPANITYLQGSWSQDTCLFTICTILTWSPKSFCKEHQGKERVAVCAGEALGCDVGRVL